jgi:CheY-specific phosphatase CheX
MSASVSLLTQLVANRGSNTGKIAGLIEQDINLTERLLRAANPRATCKEDYVAATVEEALQRTGLSSALLLAMGDPLVSAITNTFQTMLAIDLKCMVSPTGHAFAGTHTLGEVSFAGKATGFLNLRLPTNAHLLIAGKLLGLAPTDLTDPTIADDVVGELCNMITGNFQSNLCDAGLKCVLSTPGIVRASDFKLRVVEGGTAERHGFSGAEFDLFADLSVNPWSE